MSYATPSQDAQTSPDGSPIAPTSVVTVLELLLRRRRLVTAIALIVSGALALLTFLTRKTTYSAESEFAPQLVQSSSSQLAGLASQFGISVPTNSSSETLDFYVDLLRSRALLKDAVMTSYNLPDSDPPVTGNLVSILGARGGTPEERMASAVEKLRRRTLVSSSPKSGIVILRTRAPSQALAVALNRRMLELVNQFNLNKRQSRASAERKFAQTRLEEARRSLAAAENQLQQWLEENKSGFSPRLALVRSRLERQVDFDQQLYTSIAQSYERARLDEVRDTPLITIIDPPEGSAIKIGRGTLLAALVGLLFGTLIGVIAILLLEYFRGELASRPTEFDELRRIISRARFTRRATLTDGRE